MMSVFRAAAVALAVAVPVHAEFITLTRRPTLESKLPTNVSVITAEDIRESGAVNVAEALQVVAGVDPLRSGGIGTITTVRMRGVPRANQVQIVIDDQPVGGVSVQEINLALIPTFNVERIEIVRGASSVLYGPNAIGGVIHIITKKAPEAMNVEAGFEARSFQTAIYSAGAGGTWGPWSVDVDGERYRSNGYMENSDVDSRTGAGGFGYRWGNGAAMSVRSSFTDHELGTPNGTPVKMDQWDGERERAANDQDQRIDNEMFRNRLTADVPVARLGKVSTTLYHQFESYQFFHKPVSPFIEDTGFKNTIAGADSRLTTEGGFVAGAGYERDERTAPGQSDRHITNWALYAEKELNFDRLTLLPAARFDRHSSFGGEVSPRLTAVFRASERWKFSAGAARSFRAPTLVDLYIVSENALFPSFNFFGNPDLDPETAWTYDIGTQFSPLDWAEIGLSGFVTTIDDRISAVDTDGNGSVDTSRNLGRAEISGAELEVRARTGRFNHEASYTFQRARGTTAGGSRFVELRLTPSHLASYRLGWKPGAGVSIVNTVEYVSHQYLNDDRASVTLFDPVTFLPESNKGKLPSYAVWNFRAEKGFFWGRLFAGVDNILDRIYAESFTFGIPVPQPTRTYRGGVTFAFGPAAADR